MPQAPDPFQIHDYYRFHRMQADGGLPISRSVSRESQKRIRAVYLNLDDKVVAMGGVRYDYSDAYGLRVTPHACALQSVEAVTIHTG